MIYYLAHPYSADTITFAHKALIWVWQLRRKGYTVFSPILHTHWYDRQIINELAFSSPLLGREWQQVKETKKKEDYVAWDLAILKGLMQDSYSEYPPKYNIGVTMLLADSAYIRKLIPHPRKNEGFFAEEWEFEWLSDGCRKEYEYCKQNHIRVLDLDAFLHGEEKDV